MNRFRIASRLLPFVVLMTLAVGCENGNMMQTGNHRVGDRELSRRMRDASMERVGRITVNGTVVDGYTIAIQGDSLEWYEAANQQGKRHTAEVHDIGAVVIEHPHNSWPLLFAAAGFGGGALLGVDLELNAVANAEQNGNSRDFNVTVPLTAGAIGAGLGFLGGLLLDPGIEENFWRLKVNTPRPDSLNK